MAMQLKEIEDLIKESFPDAIVEIQDLAGDGNHYSATVTSSKFSGKSKFEPSSLKLLIETSEKTPASTFFLFINLSTKVTVGAVLSTTEMSEIVWTFCRPVADFVRKNKKL